MKNSLRHFCLWGFFILVIGLFASPSLFAQTRRDSTAQDTVRSTQKKFQDENGDGVNDKSRKQRKQRRQATDRFIDTNGDGISDSRERGLGFRWGKTEHGVLNGKPGKGKKK